MTFTNTRYIDFRTQANAAGPGTGLTDRAGNQSRREGGKLRLVTGNYGYLDHDVYAPGTDAQVDSEVEILIPAGFVAGDGIGMVLREQTFQLQGQSDPWAGQKGAYTFQMVLGPGLGFYCAPYSGVGGTR